MSSASSCAEAPIWAARNSSRTIPRAWTAAAPPVRIRADRPTEWSDSELAGFGRHAPGPGDRSGCAASTRHPRDVPRHGPRDAFMERHHGLVSKGSRASVMSAWEWTMSPMRGGPNLGSTRCPATSPKEAICARGIKSPRLGAAIHSRRLVIERSVRLTSNANAAAPKGIVSHQSNLAQGLVSRRTCKRGLW